MKNNLHFVYLYEILSYATMHFFFYCYYFFILNFFKEKKRKNPKISNTLRSFQNKILHFYRVILIRIFKMVPIYLRSFVCTISLEQTNVQRDITSILSFSDSLHSKTCKSVKNRQSEIPCTAWYDRVL